MSARKSPSREGSIKNLKAEDGQTPRAGESPSAVKLLSKGELREALNLPSTRIVDELVRKRKIPALKLGHRTVRFDLARVLEALRRLEVRAIGG